MMLISLRLVTFYMTATIKRFLNMTIGKIVRVVNTTFFIHRSSFGGTPLIVGTSKTSTSTVRVSLSVPFSLAFCVVIYRFGYKEKIVLIDEPYTVMEIFCLSK